MTDVLRMVVLPRLSGVKVAGGSFMARCPAHDDGTASLSLGYGRKHPVTLHCHAGCPAAAVLDALGLSWDELCAADDKPSRQDTWMPCGHTKVAEYEYRNELDQLVFAVARCQLKGNGCQGFRQWRPDPTSGSGKKWSRNLPDGTRVGEGLIYRLPDVLDSDADRTVYIVEGEKDADRLWALGVPATCNPQGAGKWTPRHADWLAGRDVIIVADRDDAGWRHAEVVANSLLDLARSIEIVRALEGKDVSEHLAAGHTVAKLVKVAEPKPFPSVDSAGTELAAAA